MSAARQRTHQLPQVLGRTLRRRAIPAHVARGDGAFGWDSCDVIIVTGDAYVDHPSFGMAIIGRVLEAQGFRVGIIAQPDWQSAEPFKALGKPNLFFGITGGNMDSMVNRYTSDKRIRSDDAYTPGGQGGARPDRSRHRLRATRARSIQGCADRHRRHRSVAAPHRALRLLEREGAPLRVVRRESRHPRVRQRRAADRRDRASPRGRRKDGRDHRPARHRVRAQEPRLHRDRLHARRHPRQAEPAHRSVCDGAGDPQGERAGRRR